MNVRTILIPAVAISTAAATPALAQLTPEWSTHLGKVTLGSPKLADVNGDGIAEIIIPTAGVQPNPYNEGNIFVFSRDGTLLPGWPFQTNRPFFSAVAVGNIDDDPEPELVAQAWYTMYAWNYDGSIVPGWPIAISAGTSNAPVLADLDGDGRLDVIYTDGNAIRAVRGDGTPLPGWPRTAAENFQAPAVGDIDGDGEVEIVAGTWRPNFPDPITYELHAWNADGSTLFTVSGLGSVRGPVSLGDLDGDGSVEIVVRAGDVLHVFGPDGSPRPGWPITPGGPIRNATAALGDLDADGDLEIVIGGTVVYAYHHDGTPVAGFPASVPTSGNINSSAIIAEIDGESPTPEVLVKVANAIAAVYADGLPVPNFPHAISDENNTGTFTPSPAVGDLNGDGWVEMVFVSVAGQVEYFDEFVAVSSVRQWPMAHYDACNTSFIPAAGSTCAPDWDDNGSVNSTDISAFLTSWLDSLNQGNLDADFNGDGQVNSTDISAFLTSWLDAVTTGC